MTNFSRSSRKGVWVWLSPERAVLVLPIAAGIFLSFLLFTIVLTPLGLHVRKRESLANSLIYKKELLPLKRKELEVLRLSYTKRRDQQERLLNLVAGTSELNTLLAKLNDIAKLHRVVITTTDPGIIERYTPPLPKEPSATANTSDATTEPPLTPVDSLLIEGLEKRTATLKIKGMFPQILGFIKSLESLQVFVVVGKMELSSHDLVSIVTKQGATTDLNSITGVELTLELTAYGRDTSKDLLSRVPR